MCNFTQFISIGAGDTDLFISVTKALSLPLSSPYNSGSNFTLASVFPWASFTFVDVGGCWSLQKGLPSMQYISRFVQKLGTEECNVIFIYITMGSPVSFP